jgi:molybdopterin synthase catalytic subunit
MPVRVLAEAFDPWHELARHEAGLGQGGRYGACASFVGTMRDFNHGTRVSAMRLEHYPGMTERELARLETEARARWELVEVLIVHRHGALSPGDPIVLVAAWSAHREQAFAACRYLIEELKTRATFWKQEVTGAGRRWVSPG